MPKNHAYESYYYKGSYYSFLTTAASNIKLANLRAEYGANEIIQNTSYLGINGSFFNMSTNQAILNIAMFNGQRMSTLNTDGYPAGTLNTVGTGAIGWNGSTLKYYTDAIFADDISFAGDYGTWVQGGIAFWLGDSNWESEFRNQRNAAQYLSGTAYRSAMIADIDNDEIILAVVPNKVTVETFRAALQDYIGITDTTAENRRYKAIMLDGSYSSQMVAKRPNDVIVRVPDPATRAVPQIIALRNNN